MTNAHEGVNNPSPSNPISENTEISNKEFKPYVASETIMDEFTLKAIVFGCICGIIFGASTVYLALKAGLTVSASIPISVIAIFIGRKLFKTTILENNIIQTTGSAGETIAGGVVFTLPGFLFLSAGAGGLSIGTPYFTYITIFTLSVLGGTLGTLFMIPLRRSLIVKEHDSLPYPEGTACASVLIAGEKGGDIAKTAFAGVFFAMIYAFIQQVLHIIALTPTWVTSKANKFLPSATVNADITPEYMGLGYIIGPKIAGILCAGGILSWVGIIPLISTLVPENTIAAQLVKLGYLKSLQLAGGSAGWNPLTGHFMDLPKAIYQAYIRQIGAGTVAAGGFISLIKTMPTLVVSLRESFGSLKNVDKNVVIKRTENDLSFKTVIIGAIVLIALMVFLPQIPSQGGIPGKILLGVLVIVFGFLFVTVSSRIVGLIGTSSNPISGMTIATIMGTCLIFIALGMVGKLYEPMVLVVGGMICIAAANAGGTSQDLKTGYIVGSTPRYQQIALFIGAVVSSLVVGLTMQILDHPTREMVQKGILHGIGSELYPAPQGTLMATLIRGFLSFNLDWQFVLVDLRGKCTKLCGWRLSSFIHYLTHICWRPN
jgi:OPT family oligopeptide transporter